MTSTKRLLIVGGGIAGLTAAWRAQQRGWTYTLVEASPRLGGMVLTDQLEGCIAEAGPESFITRKPQVWQLANELGLRDPLQLGGIFRFNCRFLTPRFIDAGPWRLSVP